METQTNNRYIITNPRDDAIISGNFDLLVKLQMKYDRIQEQNRNKVYSVEEQTKINNYKMKAENIINKFKDETTNILRHFRETNELLTPSEDFLIFLQDVNVEETIRLNVAKEIMLHKNELDMNIFQTRIENSNLQNMVSSLNDENNSGSVMSKHRITINGTTPVTSEMEFSDYISDIFSQH